MHFNDVINLHRIKYIEDGLTNKKWESLTLEAIAGKPALITGSHF
jgi:hypothetical protein